MRWAANAFDLWVHRILRKGIDFNIKKILKVLALGFKIMLPLNMHGICGLQEK